MTQAGSEVERAVDVFECSLARCLAEGDFTEAFYERFLASSSEVKEKFAHTDFAKQKKVLETSLYLMARATLGMEDGLQHLESVARSHSKRRLDITPSHYGLWLDCLVETAREFDPEFRREVEAAWRTLLQRGIDRMVAVYRHEQTLPPHKRDNSPT